MEFKNLRVNYKKDKIDFSSISDTPIPFFINWFNDALKNRKEDFNACVLSTVDSKSNPSSRVVLLKSVDDKGFVFFTNYESKKGKDIECNANVSLNFYWPDLERQVRISGVAKKVSFSDSDEYFKNRPRESQMGCWVSKQSKIISFDHDFTKELKNIEERFTSKEISRPTNWGGYCIEPIRIEFWQGRPSRLHDRLVYTYSEDNWKAERLSP